MTPEHEKNPLIDFCASRHMSLGDIVTALRVGLIRHTIRMGVRDETHDKGYFSAQLVTVRAMDELHPVFTREARIISVEPKPIANLSREDLRKTLIYAHVGPCEVQQELSTFERRLVIGHEIVSLVRFAYVDGPGAEELPVHVRYPALHVQFND